MAMNRSQFGKEVAKAPKAPKGKDKAPKSKEHPDEKEDRALIKKMIKAEDKAEKKASGGAVRGQGAQSRKIPCKKFG